jgi:hypothetical protein
MASAGKNWIIMTSFIGLENSSNCLLLGLCLPDTCSSLAQSLATIPAPASFDVIYWGAHGNKA